MSDPVTGPLGVGPANSFSSVSDLSEAISDMSLSTSPGSDIPPMQGKGLPTANPTSQSNEVFEEVQSRPRKRPIMRQLSSNPYLASSEMSPDDLSHPVIMGSNSYAGGEGSSDRLNGLYSDEQVESSSSYRLHDMRANSYPLASDFFGDSDSDSEAGDSESRGEEIHEQSTKTNGTETSHYDEISNTCLSSSDAANISRTSMSCGTDLSPLPLSSKSPKEFFPPVFSPSPWQKQSDQFFEDPLSQVDPSQMSFAHSSHSHTNKNILNIHPHATNHNGQVDEHSNNNAPMSSSCPSFHNQLADAHHYQEGHRHYSSSHYPSQPQSREINSWGHFYKQTDSHYKYRRSHYNSSDSDEENLNLYRPASKPVGFSTHKTRQISQSHRHKSPSQSLTAAKNRQTKYQNQMTSEGKSSNAVGVKPQVFKDRFQVVKRWFTDCNDGQKNIILKGLLNLCELPQLHLLSVHMSRELHQGCPSNCEDILTWLPTSLATKVMTYLDPVSLCRAAQVCRVWRQLAEDQSLWRRFCCQTKWRLSKAAEHKQVISHMSPEGSIQWKNVFAERFRLRNNWLRGRCTVRTFEGHMQGISCVQFDDSRIVSGSSDKTIKVWNMRTNAPWSVQTLMGHHGTVRCLHLDGNRLVSGSCDTTIKVWDLSTQDSWSSIACKVTMTGHTETVRCLQADDDKVISGSYDKTLKIWDLKSGQLRRTLRGHHGSVLCVHFSETKIVSGSKDKTIKLWNYDGHCMMTLKGHQDAVTCLMFDSTRIVSGSLDHNLKFWDVHSGDCLNTIDWKKAEGHTGVVRCLQADSWRVVSAGDDKTIKVWNLATGERLVTLRNHSDGVTCLQFNDFIIVSGSYDKTVKLWDFTCC